MIESDSRHHTDILSMLRLTPHVFSSPRQCARLVEDARLDLVQLLAWGRINEDEYQSVDEEYKKLARCFPPPR